MYSEDIMTLKPSDIETNRWKMTNGTSLIQHIVHKFRKRLTGYMIASDTRLKDPGDDIKYHPVFRWVGKELAIENTDTFTEKDVLSETTQSDFWRSISNGNGMGLQAQGNRLVPGRT